MNQSSPTVPSSFLAKSLVNPKLALPCRCARALGGLAFSAAVLLARPTLAVEISWVGGTAGAETDFNLGANWAGGNLPALYNEVTNSVNGDIAVFNGGLAGGVDNKTPTMTAAFGTGVGNGAAGSTSETWGLLGVKFVDSGWTLATGANTLFVSHRDAADLRSEATSGTNTVNGIVRFGARDTNDFSVIYAAAGGTLRLNSSVGIAIDGGGNASGGVQARGGGTVEMNTTGAFGSSGLQVFDVTTVRLFAEAAGGITGNGTGGLGTDNTRTLQISSNGSGGTVDVNGAVASLNIATLVLGANGVLTNSSVAAATITTKASSNSVQNLAGLISGNLSMSCGANANATTTISNNNTYTGTTNIASSSGSTATNTVVVTLDVLPNTASPFGNAGSAITLGNAGNSTTHAALLTNGAIEFGRNITLGAATNAAGLKTIGAAATQVGDSTFSGTITVGNESQSHLTVTAPAGVMVSITGDIVEHAAVGNGNLTKIGLGTVRLTGANTYAGVTTINGGLLLANNVSGSATGTGAVNVTAGATLGGTGTIAPTGTNGIVVSGILAPGASIGSLNLDLSGTSGTVAMLADAKFEFELGTGGATIATPGTSDLISLIGASAADFSFTNNTIDFLGTGAMGWYKLFDSDLVTGLSWDGLTFSGQQIESGLNATNLGAGLTAAFFVGDDTFGDHGDIYLQVIPEPASCAMLLGGIGMLLGFQRRRRAA